MTIGVDAKPLRLWFLNTGSQFGYPRPRVVIEFRFWTTVPLLETPRLYIGTLMKTRFFTLSLALFGS